MKNPSGRSEDTPGGRRDDDVLSHFRPPLVSPGPTAWWLWRCKGCERTETAHVVYAGVVACWCYATGGKPRPAAPEGTRPPCPHCKQIMKAIGPAPLPEEIEIAYKALRRRWRKEIRQWTHGTNRPRDER